MPRTPTTNLDPIPEQQYSSLSHYTANTVDTITQGLGQTSLSPVATQQGSIAQSPTAPTAEGPRTHITTRDRTTTEESFDPSSFTLPAS